MESSVDLGFLEKCDPWLLTNKFFPSKLGGRPAWLDLDKIPQPSEMKCADCDSELTYLCQVSENAKILGIKIDDSFLILFHPGLCSVG